MQAEKTNNSLIDWEFSTSPIAYLDAVSLMEQRVTDIQENKANELLWFLEHPHLFTAGTSADMSDVLNTDRCPVYESGRGGQVTYHGPGQRVIYVMLDLNNREQDLRKYVYDLEQWIINSLSQVDIDAGRRTGRIGIWVNTSTGEKKIASIGVRVKKWVTMHGVAININPDLSFFDDIVPCGIKEYGVTSLAKLLQKDLAVDYLDAVLKSEFQKVFKKY